MVDVGHESKIIQSSEKSQKQETMSKVTLKWSNHCFPFSELIFDDLFSQMLYPCVSPIQIKVNKEFWNSQVFDLNGTLSR